MPVKVIDDIPISCQDGTNHCFYCEEKGDLILRTESTRGRKTYQIVCGACGQACIQCSNEEEATRSWDIAQMSLDFYNYQMEQTAVEKGQM